MRADPYRDLPHPRVDGHGLQGEIHDVLRDAILAGSLPPGARLLQAPLAEHFGTSQTPVREALRRLIQEKLIEYVPRRGAFVREPERTEVEDVYSLRAELEVWAAHRFPLRATGRQRAELRHHLRTLTKAAAADDYQRFVDADMALHQTICEGSGSELLVEIWTAMDNRIRGLRTSIRRATTRRYPELAIEHREIVEGLLRGDVPAAERALRTHLAEGPADILTPAESGSDQ
jgi:DNA-binding GntR family transcriptional regulator